MKATGLLVLWIAHGCLAPPPGGPEGHHEPDPHAPDGHHPPDCGPDCHMIDEALHHISDHFDDHICHEFEHVRCEDHTLIDDEQICGTDGHTYMSHCEFVKARCRTILEHHIELNVHYLGPCWATTKQPSTQAPTTHTNPPTTKLATAIIQVVVNTNAPTSVPITATKPPSSIGGSQTSSLPFASATSRPPVKVDTTTVTPTAANTSNGSWDLVNILGSVFCTHKDEIDCSTTYELTCGSDGNFYPNKCQLLKNVCSNPTLASVPCVN